MKTVRSVFLRAFTLRPRPIGAVVYPIQAQSGEKPSRTESSQSNPFTQRVVSGKRSHFAPSSPPESAPACGTRPAHVAGQVFSEPTHLSGFFGSVSAIFLCHCRRVLRFRNIDDTHNIDTAYTDTEQLRPRRKTPVATYRSGLFRQHRLLGEKI